MQVDAVVLLGEGHVDLPPTWLRPGAAVIHCNPDTMAGIDTAVTSGLPKHFSSTPKRGATVLHPGVTVTTLCLIHVLTVTAPCYIHELGSNVFNG